MHTSAVTLMLVVAIAALHPMASISTMVSDRAFIDTLLLAAVTSIAQTPPFCPRSPTENRAVALQPWPTAA